ncbi:unnamed protein product [Mesocestoides corti]|uniref:Exonuclease 1 n=1 Tax=Mesocestoides corti TaxID=53468 RepID=A0A0R3UK75_MESCO|nr:unnamed protein product [Mesocestoides corti]
MGVNGLLRFLKKCSRHVNISDFKGYTVAVDAYCWIHRASFSCAMDLALGNPTDQYIKYCLKLLNVILAAGVRPILVFDGADLPAKSETNAKRHSSKRTYREKAAQFLLEGNRKAAQECFEKCIEVTPEMARAVIKAVRDQGVDCIVSPYESDAQLAYLVQAGYADLVVTEDSDLLMFGCKQIIFKLDLTGSGVLVTWSAGIGEQCCGIPSKDFSHASLRCMGVLSGCDYFPGIPRIGLATAAKVSLLHISSSGGAVGGRIKCSSKLHEETIRAALRAERTFRLQVVFDPKSRRRLRLTEPTIDDIKEERIALLDADLPDDQLFSYAGDDSIDASLSCAIALANVDFYTGEQVDTFDPEHFKVRHLFTAPKLPQGAFEESSNVNRIQACSPIKSILKKVHRPDGERLNKSIWNKDYKLEPVWLHYTSGAGSQPRPFCISLEDSKTDQLENGFCQNHETGMVKPVDPLPAAAPSKAQLRLVAGEVVHRNHRVFAPSVLTGEPAVLRRDLTRNGKCEESSAEEDVRIKGYIAFKVVRLL